MKKKSNVPRLKSIWKDKSTTELRKIVVEYVKKHLKGLEVVNQDLKIKVVISVSGARKTARGEAMYLKKAECIRALPKIIEIAKYNNFGQRKDKDSAVVIGYLNFKSKCYIDGKLEHIRLSVQFQKGGKYYYNLEINKKSVPKEARR